MPPEEVFLGVDGPDPLGWRIKSSNIFTFWIGLNWTCHVKTSCSMKTFFSVKWTCFQICIAGKVRHTKFKKPKTVTGARRWWRATRGGGFVERLRWLSLQASSSGLKSRRGPTNKSSTWLMVNMVCVLYSSYWCTHGPNPIVLRVKEFKQKTCGIKSYQETFVICRCKFDVFFWEHLFPQAPPEPEEDGLDDEQREVDMEIKWTCGYWRYRSVEPRFLCRALTFHLDGPTEFFPAFSRNQTSEEFYRL